MARTSNRPRRSSVFHMPSAFDLFTPSKNLVLKNIWIFGPLYAVPFIFWIHEWIWAPTPGHGPAPWWHSSSNFNSGWPGSPLPTYSTFTLIGFSLFWFVIVAAVGTIVQIMSQTAQLDASTGRHLSFDKLWEVVTKMGWRLLGLYIVTGIVILIGLILFIIPGLFMIRRYLLAPYVMIDRNVSIREAMDGSAELSLKNTGAIWGVMGVMFLIAMIGIIPIIGSLASFVVGSLYSVAPALRYRQLKRFN
ncbi:MAG TPA: hypothetical protein VFW90_02030 [Candidatus Saccharimonadales bacterium]|nr:hypothetical protein [Candidatus Saccharimonadales bacterium]